MAQGLAVAVLLLHVVAGAAPRADGPRGFVAPATEVIVHVAAHDRHSGLVIPTHAVPPGRWAARDHFATASWLEVGWGDRAYYRTDEPGVWLGLRALFWPTDSTLHVLAGAGMPATTFPDSEVVALRVTPEGFARLIDFIVATHEHTAQGEVVVLGPGQQPRSLFYASQRPFHLVETCNTWVAHALASAGLPISPRTAMLAAGLMRQVRALQRAQAQAR